MADELQQLESWYAAQCDDDWEHQFGVKIDTLDNPGWHVVIDLAGTALNGRDFPVIDQREHDTEWMYCAVKEGRFDAVGGARMLSAMIREFLAWAKREQ